MGNVINLVNLNLVLNCCCGNKFRFFNVVLNNQINK